MGDISYFISKVEFILHPTFLNHVRVVTKPPYEVVETGWGEFEIKIRVHFIDPKEKPVELFHHLTLFPPNGEPQQPKQYIIKFKSVCILFSFVFSLFSFVFSLFSFVLFS